MHAYYVVNIHTSCKQIRSKNQRSPSAAAPQYYMEEATIAVSEMSNIPLPSRSTDVSCVAVSNWTLSPSRKGGDDNKKGADAGTVSKRYTKRHLLAVAAAAVVVSGTGDVASLVTVNEGGKGSSEIKTTAHKNDAVIERGGSLENINSLLDEKRRKKVGTLFAENNYLLFYPHAGYTNQIIALGKAAELARLVNRTLVLPPVLPHCPDGPKKYAWGCQANEKTDVATTRALDGAFKVVVAGRKKFPSFTEIVDFDLFPTEYKFVDQPDFVDMFLEYHRIDTKGANLTTEEARHDHFLRVERLIRENFRRGNRSLELHELMYSSSGDGGHRHNEAIVALFQKNFPEQRSRVAVIGSAFRLNLQNSKMVQPFVQPTEKFRRILGHILSCIGTEFVAAHIRIPDFYVWTPKEIGPDCLQQRDLREMFSKLLTKIGEYKPAKPALMHAPLDDTSGAHDSICSSSSNGSKIIYLGSNLDRAKECVQAILLNGKTLGRGRNSSAATGTAQPKPTAASTKNANNSRIRPENIITLADVVTANPHKIQELIDHIQLEDSTKDLVLDQLLLGIGRVLVTENGMSIRSTFARMLRCRQDHRKDVLSRIWHSTQSAAGGAEECMHW